MVKKKIIIVNAIYPLFAIQRNRTSLNSIGLTSGIFISFSKEDQVCNYIEGVVYNYNLPEAVSI